MNQTSSLTPSTAQPRLSDRTWLLIGMSFALLAFLTTLQTTINGSNSYYATDTGEIQNALLSWGTLHGIGYPQYCVTGSLIVTVLRLIGIAPATGASLVSTFWAIVSVALFILLAHELGAPMPTATLAAWFVALSTSMWMNASLAEMHSLTVSLTFATFLFAIRFGRHGRLRDLLWLTFCFTQGVVHQRSVLLIAPAVAVLIAAHWRAVRHHIFVVIGIATLAPLMYLYIVLRIWMNGAWVFERRIWKVVMDNQAERLISIPADLNEWQDRLQHLLTLLHDDLPLPLLGIGLAALLLITWSRSWREAVGLLLGWLPSFGLGLVVWGVRPGDALLAAKLPLIPMAGLGLALLMGQVSRRITGFRVDREIRAVGVAFVAAGIVALGIRNHPKITAVTRDRAAEETIRLAEQVAPPPDNLPSALVAFWGNQYWALSYAQDYQGRLPGIRLVRHYLDHRRLLAEERGLLMLSRSFYWLPVSYWERRLGQQVTLSSAAPGVVQMSGAPQTELTDMPAGPELDLENGIHIAFAELSQRADGRLLLRVVWRATAKPTRDYRVAVQLIAHDPPRGTRDILARVDYEHPVEGWYPTSRWTAGEYVTDHYLVEVPPETQPAAVRVTLLRSSTDPSLAASPWLSLPIASDL